MCPSIKRQASDVGTSKGIFQVVILITLNEGKNMLLWMKIFKILAKKWKLCKRTKWKCENEKVILWNQWRYRLSEQHLNLKHTP